MPAVASERATSTLASGPAGSHFEGQIGAFYLLSMLSGAPPRGLPGTAIERVAFQQANTGRPLDDVVVHAHDLSGKRAVLEIQVKRDITFSPADPIFRKVVGQIVKASQREDFLTIRYELAIATSKGSRKIGGAYQDTLMLARQMGDATTFVAQIGLEGVANADMRAFVRTFRSHLRDGGAPDDDTTTWQLLRRLQILTFDFTATGSVSEELARERAAHVLHGDDVSRAGALWGNLVELAIDVAKSGGDRTRETLLQSLAPLGFRFPGDRRHARARAAIAEASRLALVDIRNRVGNVVLTRQQWIAAVHDALHHGRYVEIRGDAGVGKSGVLRQLAEQLSAESQVVVLSPGRCVPRGWQAMRAQFDFDGSVRDLLVELANDGGVTLFIDNLDFFSDEERLTVVDLVSEAASVPGISVIVTARPGFGIDEPSWLPADALDRLGRAAPVEIDGLSKAEIEQLKVGDPTLAPLLADTHPAHQVTRNLFRLAHIANQAATDPLPRTEVDMAEQWWKTADGSIDKGLRDRSRLLQDAVEQTFLRVDILDVEGRAADPIDALVASGTLRNLGVDRVAFRHDVFREWAIANALHTDVSWLDRLDLARPAPAMLARGIELASRMAIERGADGKPWHFLVDRLSRAGAHLSWRRAALLALVRSEACAAVLQRASPELLGNHATLLRELIRTIVAVEVVPASAAFLAVGMDAALIPPNLNMPRGSGWLELIVWLLSLGEKTPAAAIPEIVELYTTFSLGTLGVTAITPLTTRCIYDWLRLMEPRNATSPPSDRPVFWEGLQHEQVKSLKFDLRNGFVVFSRSTPELAAEYLNAVARSEHNEELVRSILKMCGTLAQAAPAELADLTAQVLIKKPQPRERYGHECEEPFTFLDTEFLPASPAQGPFFDLLVNSPEDGLALVHQLVDHAIAYESRGRPPGANAIILAFPGVARSFPWSQTYFWSRTSNYYCVTSALMALEAWGHRRLDAGEAFEAVLSDVLGPVGSAAAYLLVAVDLIISHWPKSMEVATVFLGCPELLCLDHTRQVYDGCEAPDFFGLNALRTEPRGAVSRADLKSRGSRRATLDVLIDPYALMVSPGQLGGLVALLRDAEFRLGPPSVEADLGAPEFMVVHALNLAEPANWPEVEVALKDGSTATTRQYMSPTSEQKHLQALRNAAAGSTSDFAMQLAISLATENSSHLSPENRAAVVAWARRAVSHADPELGYGNDSSSHRIRKEAILTAAMIAIRDGDIALRAEYGEWARDQLTQVLHTQNNDPALQIRTGLRFNPTAIAYVGLIHVLRHRNTTDDVRALLEIAAYGNHAAAHGFGASASVLEAIDARLPCALLRCAFTACILPNREWDLPVEEVAACAERRLQRAKAAVDSEIAWLGDVAPEPQWPTFPCEQVRRRRRFLLPGAFVDDEDAPEVKAQSSNECVNHQAAALWLCQTHLLPDATTRPWLCELTKAYMPWTLAANGAGIVDADEVGHPPSEWNDAFFALSARCLVGLSFAEIDKLALTPITTLPDRHFFDVLTNFLRGVDATYFGGSDIPTAVAVDIRMALASRMMVSLGWKRLSRSKDMSIEMHLGPAIAVLFFNDHLIAQSTKCYLYANGVERIEPFLPLLVRMTQSAPSPFVALVLMNLLEVAPQPGHLALLVIAGKTWLETYPDFRPFWIDHGFGRRWCMVVDSIRTHAPTAIDADLQVRWDIDAIVAVLVGLGVSEANRLEEALRQR